MPSFEDFKVRRGNKNRQWKVVDKKEVLAKEEETLSMTKKKKKIWRDRYNAASSSGISVWVCETDKELPQIILMWGSHDWPGQASGSDTEPAKHQARYMLGHKELRWTVASSNHLWITLWVGSLKGPKFTSFSVTYKHLTDSKKPNHLSIHCTVYTFSSKRFITHFNPFLRADFESKARQIILELFPFSNAFSGIAQNYFNRPL